MGLRHPVCMYVWLHTCMCDFINIHASIINIYIYIYSSTDMYDMTRSLWAMTYLYSYASHGFIFVGVTWHIQMCTCDMTYTHECDIYTRRCIYGSQCANTDMHDITHSYVCHDSFTFICMTRHMRVFFLFIFFVQRDRKNIRSCSGSGFCCRTATHCNKLQQITPQLTASTAANMEALICMTWLLHMCAMTHSYSCVSRDCISTCVSCNMAALICINMCNTLQHTATHCITLQHGSTDMYQHVQQTATHCNTLQHITPHRHISYIMCKETYIFH